MWFNIHEHLIKLIILISKSSMEKKNVQNKKYKIFNTKIIAWGPKLIKKAL